MTETLEFSVLGNQEVADRVEDGLMRPLGSNAMIASGVKRLICGDSRSESDELHITQRELYPQIDMPARVFGSGLGLAKAYLVAYAAQEGEAAALAFIKNLGEMPYVTLAAAISDSAYQQGIDIVTFHSDVASEENGLEIIPPDEHSRGNADIGCRAGQYAGPIVFDVSRPSTINQTISLLQKAGHEVPHDALSATAEGAEVVGNTISPVAGVTRQQFFDHAIDTPRHTSTTILKDTPAGLETAIVMDLIGYKSDPRAHIASGIPRYQHSPGVAEELIDQFLTEHPLDRQLLYVASLALGVSTAAKLQTPGVSLPVEILTV